MPSYLNKAQKEALISLGGVTSFCEELATTEWIKEEADKEKLRQAHKLTMEVMEDIEKKHRRGPTKRRPSLCQELCPDGYAKNTPHDGR